jgi:hypothetical protein
LTVIEPVKMPPRITMYSGAHVNPLDLQPEDILLEDIAHHLAMQVRWTGAVKWHYSVAQHAWICSYLVPKEDAYDALHHDDPEAYLQDMSKPLKVDANLGRAYRAAERRIEKVIAPVLGVDFGKESVHTVDVEVLCAEANQLVHGYAHWGYYQDVIPAPITIKKWTPERAEREFLKRHYYLLERKTA